MSHKIPDNLSFIKECPHAVQSLKAYNDTFEQTNILTLKEVVVEGRTFSVIIEKGFFEKLIDYVWHICVEYLRLDFLTCGCIEKRDSYWEKHKSVIDDTLKANWSIVNTAADYLRQTQSTPDAPGRKELFGNKEYSDIVKVWNDWLWGDHVGLTVWNGQAFMDESYPTFQATAMNREIVAKYPSDTYHVPRLENYINGFEAEKRSIEIRFGLTVAEMAEALHYDIDAFLQYPQPEDSFYNIFEKGLLDYITPDSLAKMPLEHLNRILAKHIIFVTKSYDALLQQPPATLTAMPVESLSKETILKMTVGQFAQLNATQMVEAIDYLEPHMLWLVKRSLNPKDWFEMSDDKFLKIYPADSSVFPIYEEFPKKWIESLQQADWSKITTAKLSEIFHKFAYNACKPFQDVITSEILPTILDKLSPHHFNWLLPTHISKVDLSTLKDELFIQLPASKLFSAEQLRSNILRLSDTQRGALSIEQREILNDEARNELKKLGVPFFFAGIHKPENLDPSLESKFEKLAFIVRTHVSVFNAPRPTPQLSTVSYDSSNHVRSASDNRNGTTVFDGTTTRFIPARNGSSNVSVVQINGQTQIFDHGRLV